MKIVEKEPKELSKNQVTRLVRSPKGVWFGILVLFYCLVFLTASGCDNQKIPDRLSFTSFSFLAVDNETLAGDVIANIDNASSQISATVPYGTDVTALVATFTSNGTSVSTHGVEQISGVTPNDFWDGLYYSVAREDGTFRDYWVYVIVVPNPAKELTSFSFLSAHNAQFPVDLATVITGSSITTTVVSGTVVTGLVAAFETTGVGVSAGGIVQESGMTANDFSSEVVYTVEAEDGSTRDYTVRVIISTLAYGDSYAGGLLFYMDGSGHGLVAAPDDLGMTDWSASSTYVGGTGREIGTGAANTYKIVSVLGDGSYAARVCYDLSMNGYTDWFLPSMEELHLMYTNLHLAGYGNFDGFPRYFSSSEIGSFVLAQDFDTGAYNLYGYKWTTMEVRAARAF